MSTIQGTPESTSRLLRGAPGRVPLPGLSESLSVPNPVYAPGANNNDLGQLLGIMDQIGQVANQASSLNRQQQAEQRRIRAEQDQAAKEAERNARIFDEGRAVNDFQREFNQFKLDQVGGKVPVPLNPNAAVDAFVAQHTSETDTPAYADQFRKLATNYLGDFVTSTRATEVQKSRAILLDQATGSFFANADNAASIDDGAANLRAVGFKDFEVQGAIANAAERVAEVGGDRPQLDQLLSRVTDPQYEIAKSTIESKYKASKSREQTIADSAASDRIGTLLVGTDGTNPRIADARSALASYVENKSVSGSTLKALSDAINAKEASVSREARASITEEQKRAIQSNHVIAAMSLIPSGNLSRAGGLSQDIKDEDGNVVATVKLGDEETRRTALNAQLAANDGFVGGAYGLVPDNFNPSLSERNVATASYNGTLPDQWKRDMTSGFASASTAVLTNPDAPLPQSLIDGAATFRRVKNTNLVSQIDDRSRVFYETYNDLRSLRSYADDANGGDRRALADSLRVVNGPGRKLTSEEEKSLNTSLESEAKSIEDPFGPGGAENGKAEMRAEMQRYANLFLSMGYPGSVSNLVGKVKQIVKERSIIINDAVVIDPGGLSPDERRNIGKIGESVIDDYMESIGNGAGYNREEIRFYTNGIGGNVLWELRDQLGHSLPVKPGVQTRFTTRELVEHWNSPEKTAARQAQKQPANVARQIKNVPVSVIEQTIQENQLRGNE